MKIKDKKIGKLVDVSDKGCMTCSCYWPRPDPGSFTQGQGYSQRTTGNRGYLCGTREINGCPYRVVCHRCGTKNPEYKTHCRECGDILSNK